MDENNHESDVDVNTQDAETESSGEAGQPELSLADIKDSRGVPLQNTLSELMRKVNALSTLDSKFDQISNQLVKQTANNTDTSYQADDTYEEFEGLSQKQIDRLIEQKLAEKEKTTLRTKHVEDFNKLKSSQYPELDESSPDYDAEFYKVANRAYLDMGLDSKPDGAREAVEYAAFKTGRAVRAAKKEVLSDEARRSRKLAEGASGPKKAKGSASVDEELEKVSQHMKINPKYYKKAKAKLGQ